VNIALANEFARLADRFGIDVWEAISIANRHPRVRILSPGPGVGGHCISVDPWFLVESAPDLATLIRTARQVNDTQPQHVVALVRKAAYSGGVAQADSLLGRSVSVLGLAYKADVDDLRESPAIEVTRLLAEAGAKVTAFEPNRPDAHLPGVRMAASLEDALADAEIVVLLVGHSAWRGLLPEDVAALTQARVVVDCANAWSAKTWQQAGFRLYRLGAGEQSSSRS
jgi:UDP-N-acetyl-D-mannosaminuronic acid dehydrogenase